jgi:hypothetical protein
MISTGTGRPDRAANDLIGFLRIQFDDVVGALLFHVSPVSWWLLLVSRPRLTELRVRERR